jgi:class 3 adenylate cyclase
VAFPTIIVKQPDKKPIYVQLREPLEVGRECDGLMLADAQVSRRHASFEMVGDHVVVADLGSTNGTFLDGNKISSSVALRPGGSIRIGDTTVELALDGESVRATLSSAGRQTVVGTTDGDAFSGKIVASHNTPPSARETSIDVVARAVVGTSKPDLRSVEHDQGTITIVFSDIESSTERATAMGDVAWMRVLAMHNDIIRRNVSTWGGTEVKNQGDGFMLTFPGARRALRAMMAVQAELHELSENEPDLAVRIRVGVHTGEVIADAGDIFGRHVMFAARIANLAEGEEILTSALVREIASARGDLKFGEPRTVTLKGIEGEHLVYPLSWVDFEPG